MSTYTTTLGVALAAFLGAAHGHMVMNTPVPYNLHGTAKLLQVDPLNGDTFPFPCQGVTDVVERTTMQAGSTQLVKFTGGAQHGGGSCQFSVTYDFPPPADKSKWKTIYTLIGGCPVSAAGNLPVTGTDEDGRADAVKCGNDSGTECIRQFDIPIPKELPNGQATFAWTWFNRIGNREVYMNCASVDITGGTGDQAFYDALPEMFVANIPGECTTGNGVLNIPNPGRFGRVLEQPAPGNEGTCPKADGIPTFEGDSSSGGGSGGGSVSSTPVQTAPPTASSTSSSGFVTQTTPAETTSAAPPPGETASSATSSATRVSVVPLPDPSATEILVVPLPPPSATETAGAGTGSGTVPADSQPCTENGAIICFSETSFGLCANGRAIPQGVAPGTTCTGGTVVRRSAKFAFRG